MSKKSEMQKAIENFHRVYYSIDDTPEGYLTMHHAAEHLFNAAGITSSSCPTGANEKYIENAKQGLPAPEELKKSWNRILE